MAANKNLFLTSQLAPPLTSGLSIYDCQSTFIIINCLYCICCGRSAKPRLTYTQIKCWHKLLQRLLTESDKRSWFPEGRMYSFDHKKWMITLSACRGRGANCVHVCWRSKKWVLYISYMCIIQPSHGLKSLGSERAWEIVGREREREKKRDQSTLKLSTKVEYVRFESCDNCQNSVESFGWW